MVQSLYQLLHIVVRFRVSLQRRLQQLSVGETLRNCSHADPSLFLLLDGERCGQTLQSIFETAHDPDKIIVGLVEQNDPSDIFCLEQYCKAYNNGLETIKRHAVRKDMTKVMANQDERIKCPRYNQVRLVAFHDLQAKGPNYSRSLVHHVLGNEEYCLQMDAHSKLAPDWDLHMKQEWMSIGNEFAVLSTIPPSINDMTDMLPTGARGTEVPRQCKIIHKDNGVPVRWRACSTAVGNSRTHTHTNLSVISPGLRRNYGKILCR